MPSDRPPGRFPPLTATPDLPISSERRVWDGRFPLDVIRFRHRRFDGTLSGPRTWELWRRGRAAALLPYDPARDAVVLIEQFRLPALAAGIDPVLVELPAGLARSGRGRREATIAREAAEEIGLVPDRLARIGEVLLSPGGSDELVRGVRRAGAAPPTPMPTGCSATPAWRRKTRTSASASGPRKTRSRPRSAGDSPMSLTMLALLWLARPPPRAASGMERPHDRTPVPRRHRRRRSDRHRAGKRARGRRARPHDLLRPLRRPAWRYRRAALGRRRDADRRHGEGRGRARSATCPPRRGPAAGRRFGGTARSTGTAATG